jgi:hypothetical protein
MYPTLGLQPATDFLEPILLSTRSLAPNYQTPLSVTNTIHQFESV